MALTTTGPIDIIFCRQVRMVSLVTMQPTHFFLSSEMGAAPTPADKNSD